MRSPTLLSILSLLADPVHPYTLVDDYLHNNAFFSHFTFFTSPDPTHGFVQYNSLPAAKSTNLISSSPTNIKMHVDTTTTTPSGRPSIRITSKKIYNHALIVLDIAHMPFGCGTWPAFWTVGPNWPAGGEIDIIEGVNMQVGNAVTLHTSEGCGLRDDDEDDEGDAGFWGLVQTSNCFVGALGQARNAGCGIRTGDERTYGAGFNEGGGGVYAMEWRADGIAVWFFARGSVPGDVLGGNPRPGGWGKPLARFKGDCDIDGKFVDHRIVFDTTFCGDWAGGVWGGSQCAARYGPSCTDFVANNPAAFKEAYWSINALKVYQQNTKKGRAEDGQGIEYNSTVLDAPVEETVSNIGRHLRFHKRGL